MKRKKTLYLVLVTVWLCFIFGHSLMPSSVSGKESSGLLQWLQKFLPLLTHNFLRKAAHFGIFAVLGGLLTMLYRQYENFHLCKPLMSALCCAFADETIQLFVPGRSGQIRDMWIDLGGAACAIFFLCFLAKKRRTPAS